MNLGTDQQSAVAKAEAGESFCLTGPAGTGKSVALQAVVESLRIDAGLCVAVTASTGIAALNVRGSTIHSFLGTTTRSHPDELRSRRPRIDGRLRQRLSRPDVLVVDEISMLSGDYLDMADAWLREVREHDAPFGGLQLLAVGDALQLPPVTPGQRDPPLFFESSAWQAAGLGVAYLREHYRQADPAFLAHLTAIRDGETLPDAPAFFAPCVGRALDEPTRLYPHKATVAQENGARLAKLPGKPHVYTMTSDSPFACRCETAGAAASARCRTSCASTARPTSGWRSRSARPCSACATTATSGS